VAAAPAGRRPAARTYHVRLRERSVGGWVSVEMLLNDHGSSRPVWADGAGGDMTERLGELEGWLGAR
jgi:hypothetical protein